MVMDNNERVGVIVLKDILSVTGLRSVFEVLLASCFVWTADVVPSEVGRT